MLILDNIFPYFVVINNLDSEVEILYNGNRKKIKGYSAGKCRVAKIGKYEIYYRKNNGKFIKCEKTANFYEEKVPHIIIDDKKDGKS